MLRVSLSILAATLSAVLIAGPATAMDAATTRIEPRPFYGATVTLEEGVRVFRPLPPHKNIIINPGHRTPLNLTIKDVNERRYINSTHTYNGRANGRASTSGGVVGAPAYYGGDGAHRSGRHHPNVRGFNGRTGGGRGHR